MGLIQTEAGMIPEEDLRTALKEVIVREWTYVGSDPELAMYVNKPVRADVWPQGLEMQADAPVSTAIGAVPRSALRSVLVEGWSEDAISVGREWVYIGDDPAFAEHVGKQVRRDVLVTIKRGQAVAAVNGDL